jgi:hypothetical protein
VSRRGRRRYSCDTRSTAHTPDLRFLLALTRRRWGVRDPQRPPRDSPKTPRAYRQVPLPRSTPRGYKRARPPSPSTGARSEPPWGSCCAGSPCWSLSCCAVVPQQRRVDHVGTGLSLLVRPIERAPGAGSALRRPEGRLTAGSSRGNYSSRDVVSGVALSSSSNWERARRADVTTPFRS